MAYTVQFSSDAEKKLEKFKRSGKLPEIIKGIQSLLISPKTRGKPLTANLAGQWSYKPTKKIRVIYTIDELARTILVIKVDWRKDSYKNK